MVAILGFSREKVIAAVKDMYTAVATAPRRGFHFPVGRDACLTVGYPSEVLEALPAEALESFAGVGYPFRAALIRPGDTVLDVGAGSGTDALHAARLAGPQGKVFALDMTPAMSAKLRSLVSRQGVANVEVLEGNAESIPLADATVDVVTSNGMLNLVPDKPRAIGEIRRVLRPGGRVQIADIVIRRPVTLDCATDPKLWAECVVGATVDEDYLALFRAAGFDEVTVLREFDYFAHSPSAETRDIAGRFGARAVEIAMRRGARAPSRFALAKWRLTAAFSLAVAIFACYGTLAALALLSAAGLQLAINETLWAAVVVLGAGLAALALSARAWRYGGSGLAAALGIAGAAIVAYTQLASYVMWIELAGFGMLAAAVVLDLRRPGTDARAGASSPIPE
jgi:ubiquinone/menaquinone biosynthesis C-methylase UbiE